MNQAQQVGFLARFSWAENWIGLVARLPQLLTLIGIIALVIGVSATNSFESNTRLDNHQ